ncbi:hypothetical protein LWI28_023888 [Acer negundo]|uniref:Uncharacterized protein n=1 Tax=Acer negundo TaxID=4023 RepID=A0AAD5JXR8_ACENE|nr:hypothetical protein LWI28_023888 [Acer negundo]
MQPFVNHRNWVKMIEMKRIKAGGFSELADFDASMPHTNKKQSKGKGVSSSGSSIGVHSLDYDARLLNNRTGALLSKDKDTSVKVRDVDVVFSVPDINKYYGTMTYRELDTEVPKLSIFSRYNEELVRELCMPYVVGPWNNADHKLLQHDL